MQVTIAKNFADPSSYQFFETDDVCALLAREFKVFPESARIFVDSPCDMNDVTPYSASDIERLKEIDADLVVIDYPQYDGGASFYLIVAAIIIAIAAAVVLSSQRPPTPNSADQSAPSPNNELSSRQNSARPNQRIPDIFGTVRSTPDLLMLPYSEYVDNIEYEHAFMCIGRGDYLVTDAFDDTTPIRTIDGAGVTVFGPHDSPNLPGPSITPPRTVFGLPNADVVRNVARCTAVNGQDLLTDSETERIGSAATMVFTMPPDPATDATINFTGGEDLSHINAGDTLYLSVTSYKTHHTTHDTFLSGTYTVRSRVGSAITLENVASIQPDWGWLQDWPSEFHVTASYIVTSLSEAVGPFFLPQTDQNEIWCNLIATNGMYKIDSGGTATSVSADIRAVIQPTDVSGNPVGDSYVRDYSFTGDATKVTVAKTWKIALTSVGPCTILLYRTTASPVSSQVVDGIKWKDLLSIAPVVNWDFGNVTTVYSVTKATSGALSVKQRKLNLLVTRKLPGYSVGDSANEYATVAFIDALMSTALDPYIGNRALSEMDVTNLHDTYNEMIAYFGIPETQQFSGTFDDKTSSFEEIFTTICQACFCTPFRRGAKIQIFFEKETEESVLLFGHRNKLPDSETRTVTFGIPNLYDCVEYNYVSDIDDSQATIYFPSQGTNPQSIDSKGIRQYRQAYVQAARTWQKLVYQNVTTQFDATEESEIVLRNQRVLVADNTRSVTIDGEVWSQNVMELTLSQKLVPVFGKSYVIFLQMTDGSVFVTPLTFGSAPNKIIMNNPPPLALSLDEQASARTLFWIVPTDDVNPQAFLITDREVKDEFTNTVTATNYDMRFYLHDLDPLHGTMTVPNPDT